MDAATLALLRDAHARICAYPTHRVSASVAVGALGAPTPDAAGDERERGHAGFTKSQLVHCLRDTSPPRVDAAAAQRLFALLAGAKKKVHFTPFAAAYYTATADAAARPHVLFLLCDVAGTGTATADGVRLWLEAGGVSDAATAATAFISAATTDSSAGADVGVDEAAFVAALARTDVAAGAGLCAALQSVAARLTTGVRAAEGAAAAAAASEGVLSPRTSRTDDEPATPSAGSVDAPHEHRKGSRKDRKSKGKKLRRGESAVNVSAPAVLEEQKPQEQQQQQPQQEQEKKDGGEEEKEEEKESGAAPASGITEDFSDDEEELARRKPIAFVIRSAGAAPAASVDMASHALKPPAMSMSLRVTSRGKARGSVRGAFAGSPGAESPASQTPSPTPGTPRVEARAGSTLDARTVFGPAAPSSASSTQGSTDFFASAPATTAPAPAQGASQPFDMASMFGSSAGSSSSDVFGSGSASAAGSTSLFSDAPLGGAGDAKPAGGSEGGAAAGQTSLFDSTVFGATTETPAEGTKVDAATSFFGDAPFGTAQTSGTDGAFSSSFFGSASGPFDAPAAPAAAADAPETTKEEAKDKDAKPDDSTKDASPETQPVQSSTSDGSSSSDSKNTEAPAATSTEAAAPQTNPFDDLSMFGAATETKTSTPAVDLFAAAPAESTPAPTPAATPEKHADNPFFDLSAFGLTPSQPAAPARSTPPAPAQPPAATAATPEDNPFADTAPAPVPEPDQPAAITPAQRALLDDALQAFDAGRFDAAAQAFRTLCAQLRAARPALLALAVRYHVAAAVLQRLTTAVPPAQALADIPAPARARLARVAAALVALPLHPVHRRAALAVAAVFSDYAYALFCRTGATDATDATGAVPAVAVRLTAACPECGAPCDPTLPRCLACGAPAAVTADTLEPVTAENAAALRRCATCACRVAQPAAADAPCPVCGAPLQ